MKLVSLVGARPQFIKEVVVQRELKKNTIKEILVNSGQHYDYEMANVFFETLDLAKPDYNLGIGSASHGEMTGKILIEFEKVLNIEKPDGVIVYGDTNTTLAGALAAVKLKIPLAHIEAGIRMLPKDMPEEINRILVDHISNLMFCPSKLAVENLKAEGISEGVIFSGDVMFDLYRLMKNYFINDLLGKYSLSDNNFILVTLHRDYNVDNPLKLKTILIQLDKLSKMHPVVFPIHPRTLKRIKESKLDYLLSDLIVIKPTDYLNLMGLLSSCKVVITDSGGLQKEAYFAGKHSLVVMPDTGWRELIISGFNVLVNGNEIYDKYHDINSSSFSENIYGDGNSAEIIVEQMKKSW